MAAMSRGVQKDQAYKSANLRPYREDVIRRTWGDWGEEQLQEKREELQAMVRFWGAHTQPGGCYRWQLEILEESA